MRRRELLPLFASAGLVMLPLVARSQQPANLARIGILRFGSAGASAGLVAALRVGLCDLGQEYRHRVPLGRTVRSAG
jgi:hypothetical protein